MCACRGGIKKKKIQKKIRLKGREREWTELLKRRKAWAESAHPAWRLARGGGRPDRVALVGRMSTGRRHRAEDPETGAHECAQPDWRLQKGFSRGDATARGAAAVRRPQAKAWTRTPAPRLLREGAQRGSWPTV